MSKYIAAKPAAVHLGICRTTFDNLVRRGDIPAVRLPSLRGDRHIKRYDIEDLDGYMSSMKQTAKLREIKL